MKFLTVLAFLVACWANNANAATGGINIGTGVDVSVKSNPLIDAGGQTFRMIATIVSLSLIPVFLIIWGVMYPLLFLLYFVGMARHHPNDELTFPWLN